MILLLAAGCVRDGAVRQPEKIFGGQGIGPGEFMGPRCVATGPDGAVYVIDKTARVQRFSPDGEFETSWQMPEWTAGKPTGIMVDVQNRVWVADTHYARIIIFDRDGRELERYGRGEGEGPGQFIFPTHTALAPDGTRYVSEYGGNDRISRFSATWEYLGSFGCQGEATALRRPQAIALDRDNTLWVADAGGHRICQFSPDGRLLTSFGSMGSEPGQLRFPYGLALCPDGTLLVSEFENNRVQRFDRTGKCLEIWGGPGRGPGQFAETWGVAVGKDNRFYVVDSKNHRVQMFRM